MNINEYINLQIKYIIEEAQLYVLDNESELDCVDRFRNFLKFDKKTFYKNRFCFRVCDKEDSDFVYEGKYYYFEK